MANLSGQLALVTGGSRGMSRVVITLAARYEEAVSWVVEYWRSAHERGRCEAADAELGAKLGRAFQAARIDALASAASLRLIAARDLPSVLEGLSRVADPAAAHSGLACATLAALSGPPELREALEAVKERWKPVATDPFAGWSLEQLLSKSDAVDALFRRASTDEATKQELEALILKRLKTGAAALRRSTLGSIERLAKRGLALDVVKAVEKLAKPGASGQYARDALAALAGLLPTLDADAALELAGRRQLQRLEYWHGWMSLEALGKAGQLGDALERAALLHAGAAELELLAKNDARTFMRVRAVYRDRAGIELDAFMRHIARLQSTDKVELAPQLFPSLSDLDLEELDWLSLETQRLCFYLGPTQFIGQRAIAWFASSALDDGPRSWGESLRLWGNKFTCSEIAIRALGHASVHPEASAAREALEALLTAPLPAAGYAARALGISAVARSDWGTLGRLLAAKKAELREAVLLGLAYSDFNHAREMQDKTKGSLATRVPFELLEPLGNDRSRVVAKLASRLLGELGRPPGPLAEKTAEDVIAGLRSGNYTKANAAQATLTGLVRAGYPPDVLARFVAPLADSLEACSSGDKPIRALLDAKVDLRELWPALAGAYFADPANSPLELLPRVTEGPQTLLFDLLIQPFLSLTDLADHLLAQFVYYAERRCLVGQSVLSEVPPALYTNDCYAAACVNALGPKQWPGALEAP